MLTTLLALISCDRDGSPSALIASLVGGDYDREASPRMAGVTPNGGPTKVTSHGTLISLVKVDEPQQTVTLALWIRTLWEDPRLAWNSSCVPEGQDLPIQGSPVGRVWVPSVFVENWREAPERIEGAWWLSREGRVWWSRKEYWQLMCEMDFSLMPFDNHTCWARLSTYVLSRALTSPSPHPSWSPEPCSPTQTSNPCDPSTPAQTEDNATVSLEATADRPAMNAASETYLMEGDVEWSFKTDTERTHRAWSEGN